MKVIIDYKFENINTYVNKCRTNPFFANKKKKKETELSMLEFSKIPKIENTPINIKKKYKNALPTSNGILPINSPVWPFIANICILSLYLTFTIHTGSIA